MYKSVYHCNFRYPVRGYQSRRPFARKRMRFLTLKEKQRVRKTIQNAASAYKARSILRSFQILSAHQRKLR